MTASAPLTRRGIGPSGTGPSGTGPCGTGVSPVSRPRFDETPGSISAAQKTKLILAARDAGHSVDDVRGMCPDGSIRRLSRAQAAEMIERFVGQGLSEPQAQARGPRQRPRKRPTTRGAVRMIEARHVSQINQLLDDVFGDETRAVTWLQQTWKVDNIWKIGTAANAGKLIAQLKRKLAARRPLWNQ